MSAHSRLNPALRPSALNRILRIAWMSVEFTLYRLSPTPLHGWRSFLLRSFGAKIRGRVYIYSTARVWAPWNLDMAAGSCIGARVNCYNVGKVVLAERALVSQGVHLCSASHDFRAPEFTLLVGDICIGENAWVAADAFVGPGVQIGAGAVVGARSVVMRDVEPSSIVGGNPARRLGTR